MKEYNETKFFDNDLIDQSEELSAFSLEAMVRAAAQRMISAALEAEVTEFLERLPGERAGSAEGFRGYRRRLSPLADGFDRHWSFAGQSAARVGQ